MVVEPNSNFRFRYPALPLRSTSCFEHQLVFEDVPTAPLDVKVFYCRMGEFCVRFLALPVFGVRAFTLSTDLAFPPAKANTGPFRGCYDTPRLELLYFTGPQEACHRELPAVPRAVPARREFGNFPKATPEKENRVFDSPFRD
jgi:hypothetical protein